MKKKMEYASPLSMAFCVEAGSVLATSITDTNGADGLGADDEGTGEAGIGFGNAKEREDAWQDGLW